MQSAFECHMNVSPHLLVLEDDAEISSMVARLMRDHGFRVSLAADGKGLNRAMAESRIDLVLLDLMLPGEDGLSICRRMRVSSNVPIIILTALGGESDRVVGLEMGADDYLTKPFSARELLARVRSVLRRTRTFDIPAKQTTVLMFDTWRLSLATRQLRSPDGLLVPLTSMEFDLLATFCQHPGRVLSREQLLDLAHGRSASLFDRSIDVQVSRLRRKIEADVADPALIITVRNGGYMFTPDVISYSGPQ
jgi:two-component system, OmpR family, response regulator